MPNNTSKNSLPEISNKYIPDDELRDTPSRLFRQLLSKLEMNPMRWTRLLRGYLDWVVKNPDPDAAKVERTTRAGNIKDTYFQKPTLTFAKLIEGMGIVRVKHATITIECVMDDGRVIEIKERIKLLSNNRLNHKFEETEEAEETE